MKKKRLLCALLALVLIIGGVCVWQRNNLRALGLRLRMTQEELSGQLNEQQNKTAEVTQNAGVSVRPLTDEEREKLRDNEMTRDELIERLVNGETDENPDETPQTPNVPAENAEPQEPADEPKAPETVEQPDESATPADETQSAEDAARAQLAKCVAEIYVMEAEYTAWLEDANRSAIADFEALPPEQQTTGAKYSIGMQYLALALEKEKECDARMSELESDIRTLLTQLGEDTALADEIQRVYEDEKATKKAYYLSLHS